MHNFFSIFFLVDNVHNCLSYAQGYAQGFYLKSRAFLELCTLSTAPTTTTIINLIYLFIKELSTIMKLYCSRELLLNALTIANKAISNKTTLEILKCVLLSAENGKFIVTATDLEIGIQSAPIAATIEEQGSIALDAHLFTEIIRKVNGENVLIQTNAKNEVSISCGFSDFKIMGQSGQDFPALPEVEKNQKYEILQSDLKNMIRQTIFSIAQEDSKPILTGELFELKKDCLQIVSVDGFRISFRKEKLSQSAKETKIVVPGKTLSEIHKILGTEEKNVSLYVTDKHVLFDIDGNIVISRLIEGDYIKYEQSFSDDYKTRFCVNTTHFLQTLERASLVSKDSKKTPVKLDIAEKKLIVKAQAEIGTAYEEIEIAMEGEALQIAFNPRYLIDALRVIEEEQIYVQFTTSLSPCIMKPLEKEHFRYLILPLRL